ncbi:MAG: tRNA (adenosine(37)-N6)-dimethylallyltransferase MiaA [Candidatus Kaiserbacteria bacterium]|nr:tRNA (adenosine(37)-N6)-dimethylallyltransferase MiaA [Candidatus Kaiserbacteria bacterium]
MQSENPLLVIIGPTASGKSDLAVDLALRYRGEVVSADSRQVYRNLDSTTGKITGQDMRGVPHHLLDIVDPGVMHSAHDFVDRATACIQDIRSRNYLPIVAGGTGFYIEALLFHGTMSNVPRNESFRKDAEKRDLQSLQTELKQRDQHAYERTDVQNPRRLIRTLEVIRALGVFPMQQRHPRYQYHMVGIEHGMTHLRERIQRRLDDRFSAMVQEIQKHLDDGVDPTWLDNLGLECRHVVRMFTEHVDEQTTRENLFRAIVAYAKRQRTWWKRYPETVWYRENERKQLYHDLDDFFAGGSTRT